MPWIRARGGRVARVRSKTNLQIRITDAARLERLLEYLAATTSSDEALEAFTSLLLRGTEDGRKRARKKVRPRR